MGAVFRPGDRRRWLEEALRDLGPEAVSRVEELLERREKGWEEELERLLGKERSRRLLEGLR